METNKKLLEKKLYADLLAKQQHIEALKQLQHSLGEKVPNRVIGMTACTLAAYRLTSRAIQARRTNVHELLQACRAISNMRIATKADFGQGLHSASTEPYFFEGAYMHGAFDSSHVLPISRDWKCVNAKTKMVLPNPYTGNVMLPVNPSVMRRLIPLSLSKRPSTNLWLKYIISYTPVMMGVLTLIMTELQIIDHSHA